MRRRWARRRRDEAGFNLVEMLVGGLLGLGLLTGVAVATQATVHSSRTAVQQGVTTSNALVAVQAVQQMLAGAVIPTAGGFTDQCAGGNDGQAWTASGPIAAATTAPADLQFCGLRNNSSTAYTYELHFTNCTGNLCTLQLDQFGALGCDPHCHTVIVFAQSDVSKQGTPFAYYKAASGGSWSTTSTVGQIQAVQLTFVVPALSPTGTALADGTQVQRLVVLPNALGGGS
jgi:hypothetical protein